MSEASGKLLGSILVVEDEAVVVSALEKVLSAEGVEVDSVGDVPAAREKLATRDYAAVSVDLKVPGEGGDVLLSELGRDRLGTPVVMITGYATVDNALMALRDGAFDFLPKPFSYEDITALLARLKRYVCIPIDTRRMICCACAEPGEVGPRMCLRGHAWLSLKPDGFAEIGIGSLLAMTAGVVASLRLPRVNDELALGQHYAWLIDREGNEHGVRSPISGRVAWVLSEDELVGERRFAVLAGNLPLLGVSPADFAVEAYNLVRCMRM